MSDDTVLVGIDGAVATITLNRPETHNAFDDALIARSRTRSAISAPARM